MLYSILNEGDKKETTDTIEEFRKQFIQNVSTITVNKFTEDSAKEFLKDFREATLTGQSIIPIVIDSYGGQVDALMSMIDVVKSSSLPVATICSGKAMSCGSVFLSCGSEGLRFIAPNARVMVHQVSSWTCGTVAEIKVDVAEVDRLNKQVFSIMSKNCGKNENYFLDMMSNNLDLYLTPQECVKHNLVQHVRLPKIKVDVSVKMELE